MGTFKKEKNRRTREGTSTDGMGNVKVKGENFYRYVPASQKAVSLFRCKLIDFFFFFFNLALQRRSRLWACTKRVKPREMPGEK